MGKWAAKGCNSRPSARLRTVRVPRGRAHGPGECWDCAGSRRGIAAASRTVSELDQVDEDDLALAAVDDRDRQFQGALALLGGPEPGPHRVGVSP